MNRMLKRALVLTLWAFSVAAWAGVPVLDAGLRVQDGSANMDVGAESAPVLHDWNNDGAPDLIVGDGSYGNIHLYLNQSSAQGSVFNGSALIESNGSPIALGSG